jgi:hypothetical protein
LMFLLSIINSLELRHWRNLLLAFTFIHILEKMQCQNVNY